MGVAGLLGAFAVLGAELAGNLDALIAAQFVAARPGVHADERDLGGACDRRDRRRGQGARPGVSALALATFARMAAVAGGLEKTPRIRAALALGAGRVLVGRRRWLLVIAASRVQQSMQVGD